MQKTLHELETLEVLQLTRNGKGAITAVELTQAERARGREDFDFYCFLIWPYVESSWLAATSLMALTPPPHSADQDVWVELKRSQELAQLFGKTLYHQGDLSYYEAVNKETLKNAYQRFEEEGIILTAKSRDGSGVTTFKLAPAWTPGRDALGKIKSEGKLWDFTESIAKSRREGKNRRDGATVSTRVLGLADRMGRELYDKVTTRPAAGEVSSVKRKQTRQIQTKAML